MKTRIITHIVFFLILMVIFAIFGIRGVEYFGGSDFLALAFWYLTLTLLLFCLNLIKKRQNKWIVLAVICILHLVLAVSGLYSRSLYDLIYVVVIAAPVNTPFLPEFFELPFEDKNVRSIVYYLIFFYGALLYWYFAYWVSKKVVSVAMSLKPRISQVAES